MKSNDKGLIVIGDGVALSKNSDCWAVHLRAIEGGKSIWKPQWWYPSIKSLVSGLAERRIEIYRESQQSLSDLVDRVEIFKSEIVEAISKNIK